MHNQRTKENDTIEDKWKIVKEAYITSLEESGGRKKKKNKSWIKQFTLDAMDERKTLNEKLLNVRTRSETSRLNNEYKEKHKEVRGCVKEDKILFNKRGRKCSRTAQHERTLQHH
jgi:hypothetical protein